MVDEAEFVRLWTQLSPESEEALAAGLDRSPDAADGSTPVDVVTVLERVFDDPGVGDSLYGLGAADVRELAGGGAGEDVPLGVLLRAAAEEAEALSAVAVEPMHVLLGLLAFDSLVATRELAWVGITYERAHRWARRRYRLRR